MENVNKLISVLAGAQAFAGMIEDMMETVEMVESKSDRFKILLSIAGNLVSFGVLNEKIVVSVCLLCHNKIHRTNKYLRSKPKDKPKIKRRKVELDQIRKVRRKDMK